MMAFRPYLPGAPCNLISTDHPISALANIDAADKVGSSGNQRQETRFQASLDRMIKSKGHASIHEFSSEDSGG